MFAKSTLVFVALFSVAVAAEQYCFAKPDDEFVTIMTKCAGPYETMGPCMMQKLGLNDNIKEVTDWIATKALPEKLEQVQGYVKGCALPDDPTRFSTACSTQKFVEECAKNPDATTQAAA